MAKARHTRKEKIIADLHRKLHLQASYQTIPNSFNTEVKVVTKKAPIQSYTTTHDYSYLTQDVIKICLLTTSIVLSELVLSYTLKNHIIRIPFLSY